MSRTKSTIQKITEERQQCLSRLQLGMYELPRKRKHDAIMYVGLTRILNEISVKKAELLDSGLYIGTKDEIDLLLNQHAIYEYNMLCHERDALLQHITVTTFGQLGLFDRKN